MNEYCLNQFNNMVISKIANYPTPVYYSLAGTEPVTGISLPYRRQITGCGMTTPEPSSFYVQVLPNDPAITGVANVRNFGAPITLGN